MENINIMDKGEKLQDQDEFKEYIDNLGSPSKYHF